MRNSIIMMKRYGKVNNILIILLDCDFQLLPCETPLGMPAALNKFCIHHHIGQQPPHVFTVQPSREFTLSTLVGLCLHLQSKPLLMQCCFHLICSIGREVMELEGKINMTYIFISN